MVSDIQRKNKKIKSEGVSNPPSLELIKRYAGKTYFERGQRYYDQGKVLDTVIYSNTCQTKVEGSYRSAYRVKLSFDGQHLNFDCSCPLGDDGEFCKHCVASALTWRDWASKISTKESNPDSSPISMDDIKNYLQIQKKDVLVELLLKQALEDELLRNKLVLKAALITNGTNINLNQYKSRLEKAILTRDFIEYDEMYDYCAEVESIMDSLQDLLNEGFFLEVIELTEYALSLISNVMERLDDSDGNLAIVIENLETMHLWACKNGKPNIESLIKRLFNWQLTSEWDIFYDVLTDYADIFGEAGLALYCKLAETEWAKILALKPGDTDVRYQSNRFRITEIMESLAKRSDNIEALINIYKKDLSKPLHYLTIASTYLEAGDEERALEWAENGYQTFPGEHYALLADFLLELYSRKGMQDKVVDMLWTLFERTPNLTNYQKLKSAVSQEGNWEDPWPALKVKIMALLQDKMNKSNGAKYTQKRTSLYKTNYQEQALQTLIIQIHMMEGDIDSAWEEDERWGCPKSIWLQLAKKRGKTHPMDALKVYKENIEPTLSQKNDLAYQQTVQYLREIKELMMKLDQSVEMKAYFESIRNQHKAKRNFIKLLDKAKL